MSLNFTFEEIPGFNDFRGRVIITATGKQDIIELNKAHGPGKPERLDVLELADAIRADKLTRTFESERRPYYEINGTLENDFVIPYLRLLKDTTGYEISTLPSADLTEVFHHRRLLATQFTARLWVEFGSICYTIYDNAEEWNKHTPAENAELYAIDHMQEEFGYRPFEREYIENGNGTARRNPNYLKRHKVKPSLKAEWFWQWLFRWWVENHATEAQKALMSAAAGGPDHQYGAPWDLRGNGTHSGLVGGRGFHVIDPAGNLDWDGKGTKSRYVEWKEFAAVGATPAQS